MRRNTARHAVFLVVWLLLWQLVSLAIHNPVYFTGPAETLRELCRQASTAVFWLSVAGSLARILSGFLIAAAAACLLGFLAFRFPLAEELLAPPISFLRSAPVAAVVVILLIWWGSERLVMTVSFMVIFPNIYGNLLTGLKKTDRKLLEMAKVFQLSLIDRLLWIYRPACLPYLRAALTFSLGMGFKSGVAAEIIGLPKNSIGERLYRDKIYLNTAGVFSWIIVILLVGALTERLLLFLFDLLSRYPSPVLRAAVIPETGRSVPSPIEVSGLKKSYADRLILDTDLKLSAGSITCLMGGSGAGKTTLLHLIAGLIPADAGSFTAADPRLVFQEDRLIPGADALRNLKLAGCQGELAVSLSGILSAPLLHRPAESLSGGEKRRLAIARAVLCPCGVLLMDEPFAGLDSQTKQTVIQWILAHRAGRTLLVVSHDEEDAALLGARTLELCDAVIV